MTMRFTWAALVLALAAVATVGARPAGACSYVCGSGELVLDAPTVELVSGAADAVAPSLPGGILTYGGPKGALIQLALDDGRVIDSLGVVTP